MKSVMQHTFATVPKANIERSSFDRSHGVKTTMDSGLLIPMLVDEVLPGDTFNVNLTAFARLSTPFFPIMDNMYIDTQFFAVPIRLLWDNWKKFNGEQRNPGDSIDFVVPTMTSPADVGYANETISDYMGIPTKVPGLEHSALWHRAYNLIWNEWYRDENLQDSVVNNVDDGPDDLTDYKLLRRGKRYDYFTSALPFPQKGDAVNIPLGSSAPLVGDVKVETNTAPSVPHGVKTTSGGYFLMNIDSGGNVQTDINEPTSSANGMSVDLSLGGTVDLTDATSATINELREAFQVQRLLERDARGGTRYTEIIKSHFGVVSPDSRLQRPEYLGGGSTPIQVTPIEQTSETSGNSPQGNLAAIGTAGVRDNGFVKSFTEHCVIVGLISVRADLTYQQGLNRMFSRSTRYDFYYPALSHLGEQAILNKEIFAQGLAAPAVDDEVFGYQERYAEYRYKPSMITGKFRSNDAQTLDAWHLSQEFGNLPTLGSDFIEENPPIARVLAVQDEPQFIVDMYFRMKCARPMPVYSVPGKIDHF